MPSKCPKCNHTTCTCCKKCGHRRSNCTCKSKSSSPEKHGSGSDDSGNSGKSKKSVKSAGTTDSQKTQNSGASELTGLTNTISGDLGLSVDALQILVENETIIKRENYIFTNTDKIRWTPQMRAEYESYHKCGKERHQNKRNFDKWNKDKCRKNPTDEDIRELRKLAITWADSAVSEMEGRTQFMANYRQAFQDVQGYERHLTEAQNVANSAKNAIEFARQTRKILVSMKTSSSTA